MKNTYLSAAVILSFCALAYTGSSSAQISVDTMAPAQAYAPGILPSGEEGLNSDLWQGLDAMQATRLLEHMRANPSASARALYRMVLYSGGVPPQSTQSADRDVWQAARLSGLLKLGDVAAFDELVRQASLAPNQSAYARQFADRALQSADVQAACHIGDQNQGQRTEPYWVKLRIFCHALRDEMPAAETTADMLKRAGHKDKTFFALFNALDGIKTDPSKLKIETPLQAAMLGKYLAGGAVSAQALPQTLPKDLPPALGAALALDENQKADIRLQGLLAGAFVLPPDKIASILRAFGKDSRSLDQLKAKTNWDASDWGSAMRALNGNTDRAQVAGLVAEILKQAERKNIFSPIAKTLAQQNLFLTVEDQAKANAFLFAKMALQTKDMGALRGLYMSLPKDDPLKSRIALASDALGGGFMLSDLGRDIQTRLEKPGGKARAVRDVYLALALGAKLSPAAEQALYKTRLSGRSANRGALFTLGLAAKNANPAETLLRTADIFDATPPASLRADDLAIIIMALRAAGLNDQATRIAAEDFLLRR